MSKTHLIGPDYLRLEDIRSILDEGRQLALSDAARKRLKDCRLFLDSRLLAGTEYYYGINTGFGALQNVVISPTELEALQRNLVRSHACGTGQEAPGGIIRLMLLLKIQSLCYGHSGVRSDLVDYLVRFFNAGLNPVIYQQGSLGASGDLAPLAHMSLALLGEGMADLQGRRIPAAEALAILQLRPLTLEAKEGLALLNGTQFSTAYAVWCVLQAERLLALSHLVGSLSCEAFDCRTSPFDERLHRLRPHPGQVASAAAIRYWRRASELAEREKPALQDPYAFRCIPQVHGASADAIAYIREVTSVEINSVTDNPNIFPEDEMILSGGNFHAQPIALALDHLAIALSELGSISERRTYQLLSGARGLPAFLSPSPGLHSGLMIAQYTAASIVSQNKQLCTPASVDSIVSSNGQEDHVSMAANAGTKAFQVVENLQTLLAIEWMTAAQALHFRRPLKSSPLLEDLVEHYRRTVPVLEKDRVLSEDIARTKRFLGSLDNRKLEAGGLMLDT